MSDNGSYFETTYQIRINNPVMKGYRMAGANLPAKKYSKTSPTVTRLAFESTGSGTKYIDIARALSIINRKFYRQGVYYYVNSVELYNNSDGVVDLHTCPDTWVTKNAHQRGFKLFQKMNAQVDTPRPKYHDFKVKMRSDQTDANTMDPDVYNINSANTSMAPDEWLFSKFATMKSDGGAADNFTVHILGPHLGSDGNRDSIGLIKSYAETRAQPPSQGQPDLQSSGHVDPLATLFDASGDHALEDIMDNLDDDNDQTPYDADSYLGESGAHMQHVARLTTTPTIGRVAKSSGFCAPFGLICVDAQNLAGDDNWRVVINLAAGTYHGIYGERA
jgi:hypothetical protein